MRAKRRWVCCRKNGTRHLPKFHSHKDILVLFTRPSLIRDIHGSLNSTKGISRPYYRTPQLQSQLTGAGEPRSTSTFLQSNASTAFADTAGNWLRETRDWSDDLPLIPQVRASACTNSTITAQITPRRIEFTGQERTHYERHRLGEDCSAVHAVPAIREQEVCGLWHERWTQITGGDNSHLTLTCRNGRLFPTARRWGWIRDSP